MEEIIKILHIEDVASDAEMVSRVLKKGNINCEILHVDNRAAYIRELGHFKPDIVLSDHSLPEFNSLEALSILNYAGKKIPFILVSGNTSEEYVVRIMKEGMDDYILKDRLDRLPSAVLSALEKYRLEREKMKAMAEIIAQEDLMKRVEQLAHLGSWQSDLLKGTTKWSDEAFRIYGYEPGEIQPDYEKFLSHIHPEDLEAEKKAIDEAVKERRPHKSEFRIIDKKGETKYIRSELTIECDREGQLIRLTGFNQDITEQKKAERK